MKNYQLALVSLAILAHPFSAMAKTEDLQAAESVLYSPWVVNTNTYVEVEDFRGHRINGEKVFDKISPTFQLGVNHPESKWNYFMEYKVSLRNYTTDFGTTPKSYERNRLMLSANRKLYKGDEGNLNLSFVYRKESNDVRSGQPAKNSYHSYWLIPNGAYNFNKELSFVFWDAGYYYDNAFSGPNYNQWEWESEHGFQYVFNKYFTAKLMLYTDWTWNNEGSKLFEQDQLRGYFPTKINDDWNIQPYFRLFLKENDYDGKTGQVYNKVDAGGLRLGLIVNYNLTPKLTLWSNLAWETTHWDNSKNSDTLKITYGDDNRQDFRLYSLGVKYSW